MSSPTKTPAQESASAGTTTSVSAHEGTAATKSRLSVAEYHALLLKKRAQGEVDAPKTIIEGSSVFHTDGSMPTDYRSGISDVPIDNEEDSTSTADSQLVVVTHDPATGSRRPREEDPNASSWKCSRNEEERPPTQVTPSSPRSVATKHPPWVPRASEIASRFGATSPPIAAPSMMTLKLPRRQGRKDTLRTVNPRLIVTLALCTTV
ncbi:hypothetical protein PI124_g8244 [Phytophthora idaei]|nr:hypothetical protein PI125_g1187 [Phytophthora idaei]KAG3148872.1 hypothetical protein PI126_g12277 [Phytophthora idaei]KAG3247038.1 hypothetical protein PI124_g8244 [Phytophthora idaei]